MCNIVGSTGHSQSAHRSSNQAVLPREGKLRPGSEDQAAGLRLSMVLSASGNSVQWPDLPQAQPASFRRL